MITIVDDDADKAPRATASPITVPEGDSGWHAIEVKLKNRRGDVRARPGYLRGDDPM